MTDIAALSRMSACAIGRTLCSCEASPVALTEYLLGKIEASRADNIFLQVTRDRAMNEAQASAERLAAGRPLSALDGVPIALKDLIDLAGERTTAGSSLYLNAPLKTADAPVVSNLIAAGMVTLGKTNLTEFAYSGIGLNPHFGTPHNPHSPDIPVAPGGSSSGSAVAVASGLVPCAIGSDTGGSVRVPAAFNGLVGYKSSEGRIDKRAVFPLSDTHDTLGPLARSVEDCIALDLAMRGAVTSEVRRRPVADLKLVVPQDIVLDELEPAVAKNFEASLVTLETAGAIIVRSPLTALTQIANMVSEIGSITAAEAYFEHRALMNSADKDKVDARVIARIAMGANMSAADLIALQRARIQLVAEVKAQIGDGLIAMPTTPLVAPQIEPLENDVELFHKTNLRALRNTALGNFLNLPGLALPNGTDTNGLPTSLLISAQGGEDDRLLGYGLEIERALAAA